MNKNKLNKKGGITLSSFLISLIFISMFSLGIFVLVNDGFNSQNIILEAPFNNSQAQIAGTFSSFNAYANNTANSVQNAEVSSTTVGLINIGSIYNALKLIFTFPPILLNLFSNLLVSFGIAPIVPTYLLAGIIGILLIYVAFQIMKAIFKIGI